MRKADQYYYQTLQMLDIEGTWDEEPRAKWEDGEPANAKFITQVSEVYDISKGEFPMPTLRNTAVKTGIKEIFWIYQKQSNKLSDAHDLGITWWDNWEVDGSGTIGIRYGETVRRHNLMNELLDGMVADPFGRRHIISLWQNQDFKDDTKGLKPCAFMTEWFIRNTKTPNLRMVDLELHQRSNDFLVAGFINKIQYVSFGLMVVGHLNWSMEQIGSPIRYELGKFKHSVGNVHIYNRHLEAFDEVFARKPIADYEFDMKLSGNKNFYDYTIDDFIITTKGTIPKIKSPLPLAI